MKRFAVALAGAMVLVAVIALQGEQGGGVAAQEEPTVALLAVDADPTGNTATVLGPIDDCVEVQPAASVEVDIVVDSIPPEGLASFGTNVLYDPSVLRVAAVNYNLLLVANGGSPFAFADPLPDSDGDYRTDIADLSSNYETGPGVLVRLSFDAVGPGLSPVVLSDSIQQDGSPDILMPSSAIYPITEIRAANVSVGGGGCPTPSDLQVTSAAVSAPSQVTAGTDATVTVGSTIVNAGPFGPVNADTTTTLSLPIDCTATGGVTQTTQDSSLAVGVPAPISHVFTVNCSNASFHLIEANVSVAVDDATGSESNPGDNVRFATPDTIAVVAQADLSTGTITLQTPAELYAGMQFIATATVPLSNAGPYGPAAANTSMSLTFPADCAVYVTPNPATDSVIVGAGQTEFATASWQVTCKNYGAHSFGVSASVSAGELHVTDPNGASPSVGSFPRNVFVGACGPDPDPQGDIIQNMGPQLIQLIGQLTATGTPVPPEFQKQLSCVFTKDTTDVANTPVNDCPVGLLVEQACGVRLELNVDQVGGSTFQQPSVRLAPIGVTFLDEAYDWSGDTEIVNGSENSAGEFNIRTDGGLLPNNVACTVDVTFDPEIGYEGAIRGNAPESNQRIDLYNPNVWPNDLNAERAAVESSFDSNPLVPGVTLWSRTIIPLNSFGVQLPLNVLIWKITDPTYQVITGAGWVIVSFPGDALPTDPPGSIGNPDLDDPAPAPFPTTTCAPHRVLMDFTGQAGGVPQIACKTPGSHMTWNLVDPDASNVTGDQGPRSDLATCSLDADGDGLSQAAETHWGSNDLSTDSDGDGVLDAPDNCRTTVNPGQEDLEGDDIGDICDPDDENDGFADVSDNCPQTVNPGQQNAVHPGTTAGDHCEDPDVDSVMDFTDNCPNAANPGQENDVHPETPQGDHCDDVDSDSVADLNDNCPDSANPGQENVIHTSSPAGDHCDDPDDDAVPDIGDNCPDVSNPNQADVDGDLSGDACEAPQCLTVPNYWSSPNGDADCDGFPATITVGARGSESFIGTDANDRCPDNSSDSAWPSDVNNSGITNLTDVVLFGPTFNEMGPNPPYNIRFDLNASGAVNLSDVVAMGAFFNRSCTP